MESAEQEECVVQGVVRRVTFRNPDNGYSVIQLTVADQLEQLTVVGNCLDATVGAHLIVRGVFNDHPKFGKQLTARSITPTAPSTPEGIEKYLSSGLISGIGEKTAARLVQAFGKDTLNVIYTDQKRLAKVPGVGKKKAQVIFDAMAEQKDVRAIMQFLLEHNISPRLATKIRERYKTQAVEILSRDPYLLARDMRGVGFLTADAIAMNLGLKPESDQRLRAGIYYALEKASEDGHSLLTEQALAQRARALLSLPDEHDLTPQLESLIEDEYLVRRGENIYLKHLYRAEEFVAQFVTDRLAPSPPLLPDSTVERSLSQAEKDLGISFSDEQRRAVFDAMRHRLMIITGGPGCGKTTIIRALASVFTQAQKRLFLCAPTGRAAQRMAQVTDLPASTIHRMLKFDPVRGGFMFGARDPLPADAVIVDEASMIDLMLAKDLFSAIPQNATLVLVGDRDQLPSV
ncbi:MAG: AAA family ATPase, partial [Deltaproteobacteria bacterium]|nr:AAA family ATPase [Deltaproteobacteria bacterium]